MMRLATVGGREPTVSNSEVADVDRLLAVAIASINLTAPVLLRRTEQHVLGRWGRHERRRWAVPS